LWLVTGRLELTNDFEVRHGLDSFNKKWDLSVARQP